MRLIVDRHRRIVLDRLRREPLADPDDLLVAIVDRHRPHLARGEQVDARPGTRGEIGDLLALVALRDERHPRLGLVERARGEHRRAHRLAALKRLAAVERGLGLLARGDHLLLALGDHRLAVEPAATIDLLRASQRLTLESLLELRTFHALRLTLLELRTLHALSLTLLELRTLHALSLTLLELRTFETLRLPLLELRALETLRLPLLELRALHTLRLPLLELRTFGPLLKLRALEALRLHLRAFLPHLHLRTLHLNLRALGALLHLRPRLLRLRRLPLLLRAAVAAVAATMTRPGDRRRDHRDTGDAGDKNLFAGHA
ncbi:hypothetical protein ABDK56_02335 [Sphingomonas sp. ASV193]|uniref:hypothetical protein n=1 Tax=Sphingomonas sp. ASV193 TaxID=3144405 RepID=UPI0032E8CF42